MYAEKVCIVNAHPGPEDKCDRCGAKRVRLHFKRGNLDLLVFDWLTADLAMALGIQNFRLGLLKKDEIECPGLGPKATAKVLEQRLTNHIITQQEGTGVLMYSHHLFETETGTELMKQFSAEVDKYWDNQNTDHAVAYLTSHTAKCPACDLLAPTQMGGYGWLLLARHIWEEHRDDWEMNGDSFIGIPVAVSAGLRLLSRAEK